MERPGFLNGFEGLTPKHNSRFNPSGFRGGFGGVKGFGAFGKGFAPPPAGIKLNPAKFTGGQWVCDDPKPASDANNYYHCCPSGWTKVPFGDIRPCKGKDAGLVKCGPLPEGATPEEAVCCPRLKEWVPADPSGGDPCAAAIASAGRAMPGAPETILAPDIIVPREGVGGGIFVMLGIGFVVLTGVTIFMKMRG